MTFSAVRLRPALALSLAILFVCLVRIRLLDIPLERDEGEHAYSAQLMLQGVPPMKLAYNMKLPGSDAVYALSMAVFGQTTAGIRIGLIIANAATILLIALLGTRLFGQLAGVSAGIFYAIASLSQGVMGFSAHSTHHVALAAVAGTLLLLKACESASDRALFFAGLTFGIGFLMKQPAIFFGIFGGIYATWRAWRSGAGTTRVAKGALVFGVGFAAPFGLLCLVLWRAGVFGSFWFWTVTLPADFSAIIPLSQYLPNFMHEFPGVFYPDWPIWTIAFAGLILLAAQPATRARALFVTAFLGFAFLATASAGRFISHYFVMVLPAVALAAGGTIAAFESWGRIFAPALVAAASLYGVAAERVYLFSLTPFQISRSTYGLNPFPEAVEVARYISDHSSSQAKIAVLGSEAEILFYTRRLSATGFIFVYSLMEPTRFAEALQGQMIGEIEGSRPEYLVYVHTPTSWLERPTSSHAIFYWAAEYIRNNFDPVGVVDLRPGRTEYLWGPRARSFVPLDLSYIEVFRRKTVP